MRVKIVTLGCKVNTHESESLARKLAARGFEVTDAKDAEIVVVNTCSVTHQSDAKSRRLINQYAKAGRQVLALGCYRPEGVLPMNVHYLSNEEKVDAADHLVEWLGSPDGEGSLPEDLSRFFLKVQDGCNQFCSYCIIPHVRGRERSVALEVLLEEARLAIGRGKREIVLTGIHLSGYGKDLGLKLIDLMEAVDSLEGLERLRLGSLEQGVIDASFLERTKGLKHFCDHFHLSLQSGSAEILRRMNRHYSPQEFLEKVELIREFYPEAAITTDIIVGFPGESEEQFLETLHFVKEAAFSQVHVFTYSKRLGTRAAMLKDMPLAVKKERSERLREVTDQLRIDYLDRYVGRELEVLFEKDYGHSKQYLQVFSETWYPENTLVNLWIQERRGMTLWGKEKG